MKIEHTEVYGWKAALRGMRQSRRSHSKSDTEFYRIPDENSNEWLKKDILCLEYPLLGPNDLSRCKKLIKAGSEHRKFLRQIQVWVDFTLPRYIWAEVDTYKVSTVRNSESSMDLLGTRDLTTEDFEDGDVMPAVLTEINILGYVYRQNLIIKQRDYSLIRKIKRILPEAFLQKATYSLNYETLINMFHQRRSHRLPEWNKSSQKYSICKWILDLPYMRTFLDLE